MTKQSPEIIAVNSRQVEEMLDRATGRLSDGDAQLMRRIIQLYSYITDLVEDKNTTIARLRKLLFGATSEKSQKVLGDGEDVTPSPPPDGPSDESSDSDGNDDEDPKPSPGHGRYGADDYPGADQVEVKHPTLTAGDPCPDCSQGTLYEKPPSVLVRLVGQVPVYATVYRMQKLRCHVCGKIFTAPVPAGVGDEKYDHTVASMIGLLK